MEFDYCSIGLVIGEVATGGILLFKVDDNGSKPVIFPCDLWSVEKSCKEYC